MLCHSIRIDPLLQVTPQLLHLDKVEIGVDPRRASSNPPLTMESHLGRLALSVRVGLSVA